MDVILKVISGAKKDAKIAIRKAEFLIGRSQDCNLCVGSSAVSRKHCRITRQDNRVAVEDLGSRNGTLVNGEKISAEAELQSGDEIAVGPLKFLITISKGIKSEKKPAVKTVAEAAKRTVDVSLDDFAEDDISRWLIGSGKSPAVSETKTLVMDETNATQLAEAIREEARHQAENESSESSEPDDSAESLEEQAVDSESSKKKNPGKLPSRPKESETKDSREAAVEALRAFNRRR